MLRVAVLALFPVGAWIWGDWKNLKRYYPTMLYVALCSLIYLALYVNWPLWHLEAVKPLERILYNDTLITLALTFTNFFCTALIYLSRYPTGWKQIPYFAFWVGLYSLIEFASSLMGGITYHHGWNFGWSVFFNVCMFSLMRIHYLNPLLAWGATVAFSGFIWIIFGFPVTK